MCARCSGKNGGNAAARQGGMEAKEGGGRFYRGGVEEGPGWWGTMVAW